MAEGIPLAITSFRALHDFEQRTKLFDSLGVVQTYALGKGTPLDVAHALTSLEPAYPPQTINTFLHDPDVVLATRTFGFMRLIALGAGVLALLGLLLYLQARQRSQAIASVLAQRMGFSRLQETLSLTPRALRDPRIRGIAGRRCCDRGRRPDRAPHRPVADRPPVTALRDSGRA